ncbi:unnamed protein product [Pelagomonas calceolata]|uniref:Uncharacterized protein n=1 Tax=Pelagomonas calceolata TaxID=35677 RepID=A0A8J2SBJ5_9STRA|nr:unnamed protein product [Pelagomonas calceolata]
MPPAARRRRGVVGVVGSRCSRSWRCRSASPTATSAVPAASAAATPMWRTARKAPMPTRAAPPIASANISPGSSEASAAGGGGGGRRESSSRSAPSSKRDARRSSTSARRRDASARSWTASLCTDGRPTRRRMPASRASSRPRLLAPAVTSSTRLCCAALAVTSSTRLCCAVGVLGALGLGFSGASTSSQGCSGAPTSSRSNEPSAAGCMIENTRAPAPLHPFLASRSSC